MFKNLRNKSKNKKGFTMVELIVVIVIILVLGAALVPQLLKYVDKANQASCKADAATILSQIQADFAASQASDETGVTTITGFEGVTVTKLEAEVQGVAKDNAAYYAKTIGTGDNAYQEITSFGYNNGKYMAIWSGGGWKVTKSK